MSDAELDYDIAETEPQETVVQKLLREFGWTSDEFRRFVLYVHLLYNSDGNEGISARDIALQLAVENASLIGLKNLNFLQAGDMLWYWRLLIAEFYPDAPSDVRDLPA